MYYTYCITAITLVVQTMMYSMYHFLYISTIFELLEYYSLLYSIWCEFVFHLDCTYFIYRRGNIDRLAKKLDYPMMPLYTTRASKYIYLSHPNTVFLWRIKMPLDGASQQSQQGHSWDSVQGWKHDHMWKYVTKHVFNSLLRLIGIYGEKKILKKKLGNYFF